MNGHELERVKPFRYIGGGDIESDVSQQDVTKSRISEGFQTMGWTKILWRKNSLALLEVVESRNSRYYMIPRHGQ